MNREKLLKKIETLKNNEQVVVVWKHNNQIWAKAIRKDHDVFLL